jgi:hypothetical protein
MQFRISQFFWLHRGVFVIRQREQRAKTSPVQRTNMNNQEILLLLLLDLPNWIATRQCRRSNCESRVKHNCFERRSWRHSVPSNMLYVCDGFSVAVVASEKYVVTLMSSKFRTKDGRQFTSVNEKQMNIKQEQMNSAADELTPKH